MESTILRVEKPFHFLMGGVLPHLDLAYETWGNLNPEKSNAVLLFGGLSASQHACSNEINPQPGWWQSMIGPGYALDTNNLFVICVNHLGGCFGTTGPSSMNPATRKPYGPDFPPILLRDVVRAAQIVVASLAIKKLKCVIGSSLGGMLALEYAANFDVERIISISASGRPGPQSISFRYVQRQVIMNDPNWANGWYYGNSKPTQSMAIARQIGNISYRSREEWEKRFGRARTGEGYSFGPDFQVESYLSHMGNKLADQFDPNSFLFLSKAMDLFSLGYGFPSYQAGVSRIKSPTLIMGVLADMLFPFSEQESLYHALMSEGVDVSLVSLDTPAGHDAFLVEVDLFTPPIQDFLK